MKNGNNLLEPDILEKLSRRSLVKYIISHPSHIGHVQNCIDLSLVFCGSDWIEIIKEHPFIGCDSYCDWKSFDHWDITNILCLDYNQYRNNFPDDLSLLEGYNWVTLLTNLGIDNTRDVERECDISRLDGCDWVSILVKNVNSENLLGKCDYSIFDREDWVTLLLLSHIKFHGRFIDKVKWNLFNREDWVHILCNYPEYMKFYKNIENKNMNVSNWIDLIKTNPKLEASCDIIDQFTITDIANMVNKNIRCIMVDHFNWNDFTKEEWDIIDGCSC